MRNLRVPTPQRLLREPDLSRLGVHRRTAVQARQGLVVHRRSVPTSPPFVVPEGGFQPFAIAAVELADEGLVILGQLTPGATVHDIKVGDEVELTVGTLFSDDDNDYQVWRWAPVARKGES